MRRLKTLKVIALVVATALPGNTVAGWLAPMHHMPVASESVAAAVHHHDGSPSSPDTSCAATCAASTSCGSTYMPLAARMDAAVKAADARSPTVRVHIPGSITTPPASPPPRA
jgi:hypothetical protein